MADFKFVIPLSLQMLEESDSSRQYVVTNVFTAWEINNNMKGEHFMDCVCSITGIVGYTTCMIM